MYEKWYIHNQDFKRVLSDRELKQFFRIIDKEFDYLFFMLMYVSGCRIGTILKLKISDIDFINSRIYIKPNKQYKRSKTFSYNIPEFVMLQLKDFCLKHKWYIYRKKGHVFYSPHKDSFNSHIADCTMRDKFNIYRKRCNLHFPFYIDKAGKKRSHVRTHTLRATSINKILKESNGNILAALQHSKHDTLLGFMPYMDAYKEDKIREIQNKVFDPIKIFE